MQLECFRPLRLSDKRNNLSAALSRWDIHNLKRQNHLQPGFGCINIIIICAFIISLLRRPYPQYFDLSTHALP